MHRRAVLTGVGSAIATATAGCLGSGGGSPSDEQDGAATPPPDTPCPSPTPGSAANIRLSSIGQQPTDDDEAVTVMGMVRNDGDAATDTTVTAALLNGSKVVTSRSVALGELAPDESASFSLTLDANPASVDGRRITFD